eukprot:COSAG02_NODE_46664_length_347_cov_0.625000_1_plen_50_part_01
MASLWILRASAEASAVLVPAATGSRLGDEQRSDAAALRCALFVCGEQSSL